MRSMVKCFQDVSLAPITQTETESTYNIYKEHKHGTLHPHLFSYIQAERKESSLGETVADVEICTRNDALDDLDGDDDEEEDGSSEDESDAE